MQYRYMEGVELIDGDLGGHYIQPFDQSKG
jgi:hypothetical protein